jgi:uncharacterized membrane protein
MGSDPTTPIWVLTATYWFHMAATVIWIGGVFFQSTFLQAIVDRLSPEDQAGIMEQVRRRFNPIAWLCLAILVVTGLTQMTANANYTGFLSIANPWAKAILAKHLVFAGMVLVAAIQTWWLGPQISTLLLRLSREPSDAAEVYARHRRLVRINMLLSLLVLAFTAIARTA